MNRKITRADTTAAAEKYKNRGKWGARDEIGALNYTPAEDCAADGVYGFRFVAPAIPITGLAGAPTNPRAVK